MKNILSILLFSFLLVTVYACRKIYGEKMDNFPNGRYTGVFVYDTDTTLPISFTKIYVGTKTKVLTNSKKGYNVVFKFFQTSQFDSIQLRISLYNNIAHVGSYLTQYDITLEDDTIFGVQYGSSDSTYHNTLTLTYTP